MTTSIRRAEPGVLVQAGILLLGAIAPLLDTTVISVALDTLGREFRVSVATVQWVSSSYLLALVTAIPVTGWAVDRFGARRMWIGALLLFLAGSLLCATAWDIGSLIAFRVLQGLGTGLMLPIMQTLLMRAAGGRNLGRLVSVVTLPALLGPILGPVIGGLVVGHASWRWIFLVNVPICIAAVVLARWRLPSDPSTVRRPLDVIGLLQLTLATVALVYGLAGVAQGTGPATVVPIAIGVVLLGAFVRHALAVPDPIVDLRLFAGRGFAAAAALMFLSGLGLYGSMFLLPLYYQQSVGASVVAAGLLLAPQGIGGLLARGLGPVIDRIGPRPIVLLGVVLTVAGTVPFAVGPSGWVLAVALVVRGIGMSAVNMAVMVGAFDGLTSAQIPHASTATRILQQLGGTFGTAILAVVLQAGSTSGPVTAAFDGAFWWAAALCGLAVVPALALPRRSRQGRAIGVGRDRSSTARDVRSRRSRTRADRVRHP
jgi:EmrB/QacA subfamily drug resistance transporter